MMARWGLIVDSVSGYTVVSLHINFLPWWMVLEKDSLRVQEVYAEENGLNSGHYAILKIVALQSKT